MPAIAGLVPAPGRAIKISMKTKGVNRIGLSIEKHREGRLAAGALSKLTIEPAP